MGMKTSAAIRYIGPALDDGKMDVYQASSNMIAFSEFMVAAVKSTFGDGADAKAHVSGFEHGSFITQIIFEVGGTAATIFTAYTPEQLWNTVKGAFEVWKHLAGNKPVSIVNHGNYVDVTNNSGTILQVNIAALHLATNDKAGDSVQRFIKEAMQTDGYDNLEIVSPDAGVIDAISKAEAACFMPVLVEEQASDNIIRQKITLLSAVFKDGNKWRFNDGSSEFGATILDEEFIATVDSGERFGKGDLLDVDMRIVQTQVGYKITMERSILKVHKHIVPPKQPPLI
jgi:hypothetical protein